MSPKRAAPCRIFSSNKSVPANRKKGFYTCRLPKNEEIGGIFVFSGSELYTLFKNSKSKLENLKHIAGNVLFWALSNGTMHSQVNLIWPDGLFLNHITVHEFILMYDGHVLQH